MSLCLCDCYRFESSWLKRSDRLFLVGYSIYSFFLKEYKCLCDENICFSTALCKIMSHTVLLICIISEWQLTFPPYPAYLPARDSVVRDTVQCFSFIPQNPPKN